MLKDLVKEILKEELTGNSINDTEKSRNIHSHMIGKMVMVRTYSAGVHFGVLMAKEKQQAILKDSRRVYSWEKAATLSQLSQEGSKDIDNCKITMIIPEILLDRVIEVIPMSEKAIDNLLGATIWKF